MALTATICDALGDETFAAEALFTDFGGALTFSGPIATVRCGEQRALVKTVLEEPGEARALVIDAGGSERCAVVDAELAELARRNAWAGLLVYGCVRDAEALSNEPLAIKALNVHPRAAGDRVDGERDVAVSFAGVTFRPDEWLYADLDGVVVSPAEVRFE